MCESKLGADALGPPWAEVRDEVCLARAPHGCPPLLSAARPGRVPTAASQGRLWRPLRPDTRQVTGQLPGHRRARPRVHEPRESQLARLTGGTRSAVPGDREVTRAGERGGGGGGRHQPARVACAWWRLCRDSSHPPRPAQSQHPCSPHRVQRVRAVRRAGDRTRCYRQPWARGALSLARTSRPRRRWHAHSAREAGGVRGSHSEDSTSGLPGHLPRSRPDRTPW